MGYKLAIDFGMTNSLIAQWDESIATCRTLDMGSISSPTSSGSFLIPTLLYVRNGQTGDIVIGQEVREQGLDHQRNDRLFRNFKRTLKAESIFDARLIDGVPWTKAQAGEFFLQHLLKLLPYQPDEIEQLVITVPVAAFDAYTSWLNNSVEGIPIEKIHIVDESTAAALGYAVTEPGAIVLIIDFGGGTLDLSLVRLPPGGGKARNKAQVIAKAGVSMGGSDIDHWLLQEILERENLSLESLGANYPAILTACEQAKIDLSSSQETKIQSVISREKQISLSVTQEDLESLLRQHGLFEALKQALKNVMGLAARKGVYREDIQHILLVGGTSLIPSVQKTLDEYFRAITQRQRKAIAQMPTWPALTWQIENTSIRVDKPFTAVVEGAMLVSMGYHLDDHLAHGYGLRYLDETGIHRFDEIIPMGSRYPSRKPVSLTLGVSNVNQAEVELVIGQISTDSQISGNAHLGEGEQASITKAGPKTNQIALLNVGNPLRVHLDPPGTPGKARLHVEFKIDTMRRLLVTILDLKTRKRLLVDAIVSKLESSPSPPKNRETDLQVMSGLEPRLLEDRESRLLVFVKRIMGIFTRSSDRVSVELSLAALRSEDSLARFNTADSIARRGGREARLVFENILQNGTAHQRASVARHLHHFSWYTAESLFHKVLNDDDSRVQEAAIFALCKMRLPEAYALAAVVLQSNNDAIRLSAVWGMYDHPDPSAVPVLAITLQAENPDVRELALEVLGATENPEAIPVVKSAVGDPVLEVQYTAVLSWVELAGESCFLELSEWIRKTRGWSRYWILRGLFHATNYMGIESGASSDAGDLIQALEIALHDDLPQARLAAFMPLAWMRHPDAEKVLLSGFKKESDSDTQAHMLTVAIHLMSPVSNSLLEIALGSNDLLVRQTAEFLLKR